MANLTGVLDNAPCAKLQLIDWYLQQALEKRTVATCSFSSSEFPTLACAKN